MKKSLFILLSILINNLAISDGRKTIIELPALLPLTGTAAEQGEWIKHGLDLAFEEFNLSNKELNFKLRVEETQADNRTAIAVYQRLKSEINFPIVFTYGSGVGISLTSFVNKDNIVQMGLATGSPVYRTANDFTFRNFYSAELEADYASNFIKNRLNSNEIVVVKQNNDYGIGTAKAFISAFQKLGGKIIKEEDIESKEVDFLTLSTRIKALNPSLIYIATYPTEGALFIKQLREIGLNSQIVASPAILGSKEFFSIVGSSAEGVITISPSPKLVVSSDDRNVKFRNMYTSRYNQIFGPQHMLVGRAYDAGKITLSLIRECYLENISTTSGTCLKEKLYNMPEFYGVSGKVKFDLNGDISDEFGAFVVRDKKYVQY